MGKFSYICTRQVPHDQLLPNPPRVGTQQGYGGRSGAMWVACLFLCLFHTSSMLFFLVDNPVIIAV